MSEATPNVALWMPWFIRDHRAAAMTLSHVEHSAFTYLKMLLWEKGGSIADDDKSIAKALRLTLRQWQSMRGTLLAECTISGGRITDPSIVAEIRRASRVTDPLNWNPFNYRINLPAALRELIHERDGYRCSYCGTRTGPFEVDHILPVSRGGENDPDNLCLACVPCNRSKSDKTLEEWRAEV